MAAIRQSAAALSASITSQTDVNCFGGLTGSATVAASNGTAPYTYLWTDPAAQTSATATGLAAGSYTVTVTDAKGCTTTALATISQPADGQSTSLNSRPTVNSFAGFCLKPKEAARNGSPPC